MDYLFFDLECSNCFNGVGKICEFGYALFDSKFNLIKKKNALINPESKFYAIKKSHEDFKWAHDKKEYYKKLSFPFYYDKIKRILTRKNTYIFAFSSSNDIGFLIGTFKRYSLKPFDFICYDAQKIAAKYAPNLGKYPGLEKMYDLTCKDCEDVLAHDASNDSLMTGLMVKSILKDKKQNFKKYIKDIDGIKDSFLQCYDHAIAKENLHLLIQSLRVKSIKDLDDKKYDKRRYYIPRNIKKHKDLYVQILIALKKKNCVLTGRMKNVDYVLVKKDDDKSELKALKKKIGASYKFINIEKFLRK